jgi:O-acetyl-ADP-ribose deacetylase (regulator of RNase III)
MRDHYSEFISRGAEIVAVGPDGASPFQRYWGNEKIPYMISAPTMIIPEIVDKVNVYFAMSAILKIAHSNSNIVKKVFCPGLATRTGGVLPIDAANEMANCYKKING